MLISIGENADKPLDLGVLYFQTNPNRGIGLAYNLPWYSYWLFHVNIDLSIIYRPNSRLLFLHIVWPCMTDRCTVDYHPRRDAHPARTRGNCFTSPYWHQVPVFFAVERASLILSHTQICEPTSGQNDASFRRFQILTVPNDTGIVCRAIIPTVSITIWVCLKCFFHNRPYSNTLGDIRIFRKSWVIGWCNRTLIIVPHVW